MRGLVGDIAGSTLCSPLYCPCIEYGYILDNLEHHHIMSLCERHRLWGEVYAVTIPCQDESSAEPRKQLGTGLFER